MAAPHYRLARAFAVNPSRLPARPFGLWGVTAQRGQAEGPAVPMNADVRPVRLGTQRVWGEDRGRGVAKLMLDNESPT